MTTSVARPVPAASARSSRRAARLLAAAALAAAAVLLAFGAARTRALGERLLAGATMVGDAPTAVADPSDTSAFEPFAFGVVGPVHGDTVALANAVESLAARGDVRFVVLLGDVTATGTDGEFLRIAGAVRERGVEVVAVPGPADLVRLREFQEHLGAARWWFLHRECAFVGLPGGGAEDGGEGGDAAFVAAKFAPTKPPRATVVLTTVPTSPPTTPRGDLPGALGAAALVLRPEPGVRVVTLDGDARPSIEQIDVGSGLTPRSAAREIGLGTLFPLVRPVAGHLAALGVATAMLVLAARLLR